MKVLALISQKGGVAKTTIATALAVAAQAAGQSVAIFDLDPQASACVWSDLRKANGGDVPAIMVRDVNVNRLAHYLDAMREANADLIILDCPPVGDIARETVKAADMVLIPTRPEVLDMKAMLLTVKTVQQADKVAHVVLTSVPPRGSEVTGAKAVIANMGATLAPIDMHYRKAYSRAQILGLTAQEYEPSGKAAEEISALYKYITIILFGAKNDGKSKGKTKSESRSGNVGSV